MSINKIMFMFIYLFSFSSANQINSSLEKLTIGTFHGDASALIYIAKEKYFFMKNGLDIELKPYVAGKFSIQDMLLNKFDYAISTEFIPVKNSLVRDDFKIIASMGKALIKGIIVRTDSDIIRKEDLKGKRVGVSLGTVSEYYLARVLKDSGLTSDDINIINIHPLKIEDALMKNKVDALVTWEPNLYKLKTNYPSRLTFIPVKDYPYYCTLTVNEKKQNQSPHTSQKIIESLIQAQVWAEENPLKLKEFLKRTFYLKDNYLKNILDNYILEVSIPNELHDLVNNQLNWLKSNKKSTDIIDNTSFKNIKN